MVHCSKEASPEEFLTGVWVAMVARVVKVIDVFEETRDLARAEEDGDKDVLLAVCTHTGGERGRGEGGGGRGGRGTISAAECLK